MLPVTKTALLVPLITAYVPAGFPSPAADYEECAIDLGDYLVEHEAATLSPR